MSSTLIPFTDVDRLFRSIWDIPVARPADRFAPVADVAREDDDLVARFDLPGIDPDEDVSVEVDGRKLVVRGERKNTREDGSDSRRVREVRYGSFQRTLALPAAVDPGAISATYEAGVLTVTVSGAYTGTTPTKIGITRAA